MKRFFFQLFILFSVTTSYGQNGSSDTIVNRLRLITGDAEQEFKNSKGRMVGDDSTESIFNCLRQIPGTTNNTIYVQKDTMKKGQLQFIALADSSLTEAEATISARNWKKLINEIWEEEYNTKTDRRDFGEPTYFCYSIIKNDWKWQVEAIMDKKEERWKVFLLLFKENDE